jgi:ribonuclease HII
MEEFSQEYPDYSFERHKGYRTKKHLESLKKCGPCPIHRKSFRPVRELLEK